MQYSIKPPFLSWKEAGLFYHQSPAFDKYWCHWMLLSLMGLSSCILLSCLCASVHTNLLRFPWILPIWNFLFHKNIPTCWRMEVCSSTLFPIFGTTEIGAVNILIHVAIFSWSLTFFGLVVGCLGQRTWIFLSLFSLNWKFSSTAIGQSTNSPAIY